MAIVGTLVPQGESLASYLSRFGNQFGPFILWSGLDHIYTSVWFLTPLSLLGLNLLSCLVHGLPQAIQRVWRPFPLETAETLPERGRFSWPSGTDPKGGVTKALHGELGRPRTLSAGSKEILLYEKGRYRPLGPYLVHLSLLLILAGGLLGKFWGLEGRVFIPEGAMTEKYATERRQPDQPLNFQMRLDRFQVNFYPNGTPAEYRSDLTFLQGGQEVRRAVARVNDPVTFGGLTFYQSSYGAEPAGPIRFEVCQGALCHVLETSMRRRVEVPGGKGQFVVMRLDGNLQGMGPAVQVAYKDGPGHPLVFWVSQQHPQLADKPHSPFWQPGDLRFTLKELPFRYYSVLQVKRDPGVWWVYSGFLLFLPGFFLAFLRPPQRWAVVLEKQRDGRWRGRLLGASPRAKEAFAARQERLLERLQKGASS
jgi:cytochrome c biogenesis protein